MADGFGYTVAEKAELSYADDGLLDYTNLVWLQWIFDMLIGLFEQVGLMNNLANTVAMACQPGAITGRQPYRAYGQRMTVKGDPFHAKQLWRVVCGERGEELATKSMLA